VQGWTVAGPVAEIAVAARGIVARTDTAGVLRGLREKVPPMAWLTPTPATRPDQAIRDLAVEARAAGDALAQAHAMAAAVADRLAWAPGRTKPHTTAAEALALGEGVCQDHAQVLIAAARAGGVPARYATGYMLDAPEPGEAAHAWAELWVEGLGWVGFDPANRCCPDARYVRLGSGRDALDAAPIRGTARGPGEENMSVSLQVTQAQGQSQQ
jgi:transglutaminase-like putative cysteine protease